MDRPYHRIEVERDGDVFCARLCQPRMDDRDLDEFSEDLNRLLGEEGCRKLVLCLGPEEPQCLYSVFLAKLVSLQRRLRAVDGALKLCHASPATRQIFAVCGLASLFDFHPDKAAAVASLASAPPEGQPQA